MTRSVRAALIAERKTLQDLVDAAYWRFCRTSSPKVKLAPHAIYVRKNEIDVLLGVRTRERPNG